MFRPVELGFSLDHGALNVLARAHQGRRHDPPILRYAHPLRFSLEEPIERETLHSALRPAIRSALHSLGLKRCRGRLLLPPRSTLLRTLQLPAMRRQELSASIPWELDRFLPFSIDEATIASTPPCPAETPSEGWSLHSAALSRSLAEALYETFAAERVEITRLTPTLCALSSLAEPDRAQLLVHLSPEAALLAVFEGGELSLQRTVPRPLETHLAPPDDVELRALAREVERTLSDPRAPQVLAPIRLSGDRVELEALSPFLSGPVDPRPISPADLLQAAWQPGSLEINLVPPSITRRRRRDRGANAALALPLLVGALSLPGGELLARHTERSLSRPEQSLVHTSAAFVEASQARTLEAALPDGVSLSGLRLAADAFSRWRNELASIEMALPEGQVALQRLDGSQQSGSAIQITLRGEAHSSEAISQFLEQLAVSGWRAELITERRQGTSSFTLELQRPRAEAVAP